MASVCEKAGRWYIQYKDAFGRRRQEPTKAANKTQAKRLAHELEGNAERQRLGLDAMPHPDGGGTLWALLEWWLETYSQGTPPTCLPSRSTLKNPSSRRCPW